MPSALLQVFIFLRTSRYSPCSGSTRSRLDTVYILWILRGMALSHTTAVGLPTQVSLIGRPQSIDNLPKGLSLHPSKGC